MGSWAISICGVGQHHNNMKADADQIAKKFVEYLQNQGHKVTAASFTPDEGETVSIVEAESADTPSEIEEPNDTREPTVTKFTPGAAEE